MIKSNIRAENRRDATFSWLDGWTHGQGGQPCKGNAPSSQTCPMKRRRSMSPCCCDARAPVWPRARPLAELPTRRWRRSARNARDGIARRSTPNSTASRGGQRTDAGQLLGDVHWLCRALSEKHQPRTRALARIFCPETALRQAAAQLHGSPVFELSFSPFPKCRMFRHRCEEGGRAFDGIERLRCQSRLK